ncbi:MAG: hypothetical protein ABIO02_04845 [Patescibacteria group bacterium]
MNESEKIDLERVEKERMLATRLDGLRKRSIDKGVPGGGIGFGKRTYKDNVVSATANQLPEELRNTMRNSGIPLDDDQAVSVAYKLFITTHQQRIHEAFVISTESSDPEVYNSLSIEPGLKPQQDENELIEFITIKNGAESTILLHPFFRSNSRPDGHKTPTTTEQFSLLNTLLTVFEQPASEVFTS